MQEPGHAEPQTEDSERNEDDDVLSWPHFRSGFLVALEDGSAETFCAQLLNHLDPVVEKAYRELDPAATGGDYAELFFALESIRMMKGWWIPAQDPLRIEEASTNLRRMIVQKTAHVRRVRTILKSRRDDAEQEAAGEQHFLEHPYDDQLFLARVAARVIRYDPRKTPYSPSSALADAVIEEVDRVAGPLTPRPQLSRTSFGREISRLMALPDSNPARRDLEERLSEMPEPESWYLRTMYGGGGKKLVRQRFPGGGQETRIRKAALRSLLRGRPALANFLPVGQTYVSDEDNAEE